MVSSAFEFKVFRKGVLSSVLICSVGGAQTLPATTQATGTTSVAAKGPNAITQSAVRQGVLTCATRINEVTNFVGFNNQVGATLMVPPNQADQQLLTVVMEIPTSANAAYVSATFAPNQANGCGATYDAVVYWPLKCDAVAAKHFASLQKVALLSKDIAVLDGGATTKVFLMTAGSGCVSIKKESVL